MAFIAVLAVGSGIAAVSVLTPRTGGCAATCTTYRCGSRVNEAAAVTMVRFLVVRDHDLMTPDWGIEERK